MKNVNKENWNKVRILTFFLRWLDGFRDAAFRAVVWSPFLSVRVRVTLLRHYVDQRNQVHNYSVSARYLHFLLFPREFSVNCSFLLLITGSFLKAIDIKRNTNLSFAWTAK